MKEIKIIWYIIFGKELNFKGRLFLLLGMDLWKCLDSKKDSEGNVEAITFSNNEEYLEKVMEIEI